MPQIESSLELTSWCDEANRRWLTAHLGPFSGRVSFVRGIAAWPTVTLESA